MFKLFNIPINIKSMESIKSTLIVKEFKSRYNDNISDVMDYIKGLVTNKYEEYIYIKVFLM